MPSSPIAATVRYIPQGLRSFCWLLAIANTSAPTRAEINAGVALEGELFEADGFSGEADLIDAPDFGSRNIQKLVGPINYADTILRIYLSTSSSDARTTFPNPTASTTTTGFIIVFTEDDVPGRKMDVWPVTVASASKPNARAEPATLDVKFGITGVAVYNVTVPA